MIISFQKIQQIAAGQTPLTGEPVKIAKRLLISGLYDSFNVFAQKSNCKSDKYEDITDCLLDFSSLTEQYISIKTSTSASGYYTISGRTMEESLYAMYVCIENKPRDIANQIEGCLFSVRGVDGVFKYTSTYFHYCFAKGRISELELLDIIRVGND